MMTFTHRNTCADPTADLERFTGHEGDSMARCRHCGAWRVLPGGPDPEAPPPTPPRYWTSCAHCEVELPARGPRPAVARCQPCAQRHAASQRRTRNTEPEKENNR